MKFDRKIERLVTAGLEVDVFLVPWDAEIFGFPVAQIDRIELRRGEDPSAGMQQLRSWLDQHDIRVASCRLDSGNLRESMLLEAHGFRFIEMVYSPTLSPIAAPRKVEHALVIEEASQQDMPAIAAIAGSAFATGRYLLDWRISPEASRRRYRTWVSNSFEDPRHQVLKACLDGMIVGFFIIEERPDRSAYWHLTAIAPAYQGKGLGKRLWGAMVRRHYGVGLSRVETTISAHNPAVMNIYAALGFRFNVPRMTFHWVRD